jgi:hypothetical protein
MAKCYRGLHNDGLRVVAPEDEHGGCMQVRDKIIGLVILSLPVILIMGCANKTTGAGTSGGGNTVTVTFTGGTPLTVANQTGTGAFTAMTPGSQVSFTLPAGDSKYAIAFVCPPVMAQGTLNPEFVIEATTQDTTSFTANCLGSPTLGTVTGSANSSLSGTSDIRIRGARGFGANIGSASGSFPSSPATQIPVGTNDVAAIAVDTSGNVLGVSIVRAQTSPGSINNGNAIVLVNATISQSLSVTNVPTSPPGWANPPEASVEYHTANSQFVLTNNSVSSTNPEAYQAVAVSQTQSGDFYRYESNTTNSSTNQAVGITQTTTNGGSTFSVALPAPWSFSGPPAAKFPTFTFIYSGFTGLAAIANQGSIEWATGATTSNQITVLATANFQSGTTTITIPDLTSLSGFLAPAATGTTINWVADIFGGTTQEFLLVPSLPANGSVSFVQNRGTFTQP